MKQLKHQKTFKSYHIRCYYYKHRKILRFLTEIFVKVSRYKHRRTKDYFYRIHDEYWLTIVNDKIITGSLRSLLRSYWNMKSEEGHKK